MVSFNTIILKFDQKGEKTGWTYIEVPADIAQKLKPGNKKGFQVKGLLDAYAIEKVNLLPMGGGNFILPLNAGMRKGIHKHEGAMLQVTLEPDHSTFEYPEDIMDCLEDEPQAWAFFHKLPESHRKYYIKWIQSAKTETTRTKRIVNMVNACYQNENYGEMMRNLKNTRG